MSKVSSVLWRKRVFLPRFSFNTVPTLQELEGVKFLAIQQKDGAGPADGDQEKKGESPLCHRRCLRRDGVEAATFRTNRPRDQGHWKAGGEGGRAEINRRSCEPAEDVGDLLDGGAVAQGGN